MVKGAGADPEFVGLAFTPAARKNGHVEIEGTFWIERNTSHLRYLEYTYVGLPDYAKAARSGGRVEFAVLRNGLWLLSDWYIRIPQITMSGINGVPLLAPRLTSVDESGGIVNKVTSKDSVLFQQQLPSIALRVGTTGTNLSRAGVKVGISGT